MSDNDAPRNRKERRAAARSSGKGKESSQPKVKSAADIPMKQPDRSGPKGKTLFEIAEERQALLSKGQPFDKRYEDGIARDEEGNVLAAPIGPFGEALFFTSTLGMLHFTLDVLVYNQYRQEIEWNAILMHTAKILPILFFLIYTMHSQTASRFPIARQLFYLATAVAAGCYMIYAGNTYSYYAVMKRAPSIGTLWVWSIIESGLAYALLGLSINLIYMKWNGYTVF
ncbi:hypothetical protein H2203_008709 [Taxawa tesnikishii (nom. ined.)]|nr:hypothetical protein H2203_008709 [Dothideales sp. JES 119]